MSGVVEFHAPPHLFQNARMTVVVEDVTRADATSVQVARQTVEGVSAGPEGASLQFSLPIESMDPRQSYALSVHIDVDRDGTISPGDYITMESHPVTAGTTGLVAKVKLVQS